MAKLLVALVLLTGAAALPRTVEAQGYGPPPDVDAALAEASSVWGVSYARLRCVSWHEARWWPGANSNPPYQGLFQFDGQTWSYAVRVLRNPADTRYPLLPQDTSPWRARDAALAAAGLMARGEASRWPTIARFGC